MWKRFFFNFKYIIIISLAFLVSCKNNEKEVISVIEEKDLDLQMIDAYKEGLKFLDNGMPLDAAKKFSEAEIIYPQSIWAPRSSLMSAYSYYYGNYYLDAIDELKRFIKIYPNNERINFAYYLLAMSYYEQITDETKDLGSILDAQKYFVHVQKKYPNSDYATDSEFKLELIKEILASKELYLAKYYIEREKWIPAINRFKTVVKDYETTIFVEEALHRLVELHYKIGLVDESKKYAALLGYNYQSSKWYEESYKILNKNYKKISKTKNKKKEESIIQKFKDLLK